MNAKNILTGLPFRGDGVRNYLVIVAATFLFWCVAIFVLSHTQLTRSPTQQEIDVVTQNALRSITALHDQVTQDQSIIAQLQSVLNKRDQEIASLKDNRK